MISSTAEDLSGALGAANGSATTKCTTLLLTSFNVLTDVSSNIIAFLI